LRKYPFLLTATLLGIAVWAVPLHSEERSLAILFGPSDAETARAAAKAASASARRWLRTPGASAELRRAGSQDALPLSAKSSAKDLEAAFVEVALRSEATDFSGFLATLDASVQSLGQRPGTRLMVVSLKSPPTSSEDEKALSQVVDYCREHQVRVIVLDAQAGDAKDGSPPLEALGRRTGGAWLTQARALDANIVLVAPVLKGPAANAGAEPGKEAPAPEARPSVTAAAGGQTTLPVHTRFIRSSSQGPSSASLGLNVGGGMGAQATGVRMGEQALGIAHDSSGPMQGVLFVESPLSALKFEADSNAGTFQAKARISQSVRNSKGNVVWHARKDVSLRGALRKLEARKAGNLYLMRAVTIPAGDKYTLEATVEDLIAGSSGFVREELKSEHGAPGLMVSDALFVRRFKGSSDRFEADQVMSYEGEALAPLLDPVFRVEDPINLQIYFIIYPDRYGAQPELSMELLRNGKPVARLPLAFTTKIYETAMEGKNVGISGGQAHEFPYLATLKGAKLGSGEFEARISVRQGPNVLTRNVPFRIIGGATPSLAGPGGPDSTTPGTADDDSSEIVIPEVDPTEVTRSMAPSAAEQQRLWAEASTAALGYSEHLPNFRCAQETHRLKAPVKTPDKMRETDTFKDELTYEDGNESYRTLEVNGVQSNVSIREEKGVHSRGEFGTMLRGLFSPEVGATYKWAGQAMAGGSLCQVFEISVERSKSNFALYFNKRREVASYTGRVFVEEETGLVRKLIIDGSGLPKDFGLQSPSFSLDYGMVKVGMQDYLLPLRSLLQVRQGKLLVRNETAFRDYRKFEASSEMKF
jgi:hypothetical protein